MDVCIWDRNEAVTLKALVHSELQSFIMSGSVGTQGEEEEEEEEEDRPSRGRKMYRNLSRKLN
ncbi:uncharacterized, partial [Tachysurus ichikawai]